MTKKNDQRKDIAELRHRAENRLGEKTGTAHLPGTEEGQLRLLHELQVHQVELEMQNAELRQAREEAEMVLEKYTDLYDFAPVGYFTLDRNGIIRAANLTGAALVGVERSGLIGRRFEFFVPDESRSVFSGFLGKVFTSSDKDTCEVSLLKNGNPSLYVQIEAVAAASGQECRIAVIDISDRIRVAEAFRQANEAAEVLRETKEAAEVLRQAKEVAEATTREKNRFLANMSHELRTPMTGILGMLQLALEKELAPAPRGYLETSLSSAQSLLRILNDILDMAKIEAGKITIEEKAFSPGSCVTDVVDLLTPEAQRKGLDISLSIAEEVPDTVIGDQMRLRQILLNLIGNAVKFTERGKVEVRVIAGGATSDGKRDFAFAITDTGIGIPENKKELLFRAFSQMDDSHSRSFGGTGLGLAISRELVELMGGTICFESAEGMGSTFSFTIPLAEARPESGALSAVEPQSSVTTDSESDEARIWRILLAEDDPASRKVFGIMLRKADYYLDIAEDGLKAVEMWENGEYDLVLMDVQMPRLDGFEATRAIREKERERGGHIPIVAMTAHAFKEDEMNCLAAGMDAYISKPIDFKKSLKLIAKILKQK